MARRKPPTGDAPAGAATPNLQDEADIVEEIGATPANDGSGELEIDEAKLREVGAVDAESVLENRRGEDMVNKVRGGQKGVLFNLDNVLEKYDLIIRTWPPNTIDILVSRVTGTPVQWVIQSRPRSGADLYTAILAHHARCEEAKYDVRFIDSTGKQRRGTGNITMPDTRETPPMQQPQQGQSMQQPLTSGVVQVGPPPAVDPVAMMRSMFEMFQQMQKPAAAVPVPQPVPTPAPASFPGQSTDPMAMMRSMFEIFQQMQQTSTQQSSTSPVQGAQPSTDPMVMMRSMFEMFQQLQPQQSQPTAATPSPPPQTSDPNVMMAWMLQSLQKAQQPQPAPAPAPAPQSSTDPMAMMRSMFDMFLKMQQAVQPPPPPQTGPYRGPYGGPRAGQPGEHTPPYQPPSAQRPKSMADEFRDSATFFDSAGSLADRFRPPAAAAEPERYDRGNEDDSPVKVVDVGGWPVIVNKSDGSARKWETGVANLGNVLKWFGEQREAIQKSQAEREAKQRRTQQTLPPGYVEVSPGYQPPPGYVAVPVEMNQGLPQPPEDLPPPITQQEPPPAPKSRTWGAPPMPGGGG